MNMEKDPSTVVYRSSNTRASIKSLIDGDVETAQDRSSVKLSFINEDCEEDSSSGSMPPTPVASQDEVHVEEKKPQQKVSKLDWKEGVFVPCLLNIWGVIMFLRLGWVVGQAGIVMACLVVFCAKVVTTVTALSLCAICTNGEVKGGGVYFLISRALGPVYGGVIGVLFFLAQAVATSLYVIGFAESLSFLLVLNDVPYITGDPINDIRVFGLITTCLLLAVALVGVSWYAKCSMGLLVTLVISMISVIVGAFFPAIPDMTTNADAGFVGFQARNWWDSYTVDPATGKMQSFFSVFAVFFPAATGVMAGANLSGDLKDPSHAIPKGTLGAIALTFVSYIGLIFVVGTACLVCTDVNGYCLTYPGDMENIPQGGLIFNKLIMQNMSIWAPLLYLGVFAATLSSALASLVGAPRILQSVASDQIFPWPWFNYFGEGRGPNNEPVRAYILTFVICCGCCLIGKLDVIAPIISNFFMISYAFTNYACFASSAARYPGWRPSFKYYNKWLSLFGFVLCIVVMFMMDWVYTIITLVLGAMLYAYLIYLDPDVNWGAAGEARKYFATLKSMTDLQSSATHVKTFRPQYLIMSGTPGRKLKAAGLVKFVSLLAKGGGIVICGDVVVNSELEGGDKATTLGVGRQNNQRAGSCERTTEQPTDEDVGTAHVELASNLAARLEAVKLRRLQGEEFLSDKRIWGGHRCPNTFFEAVVGETLLHGFESLLQTTGVGMIRPNTVVFGYKSNWQTEDPAEVKQYEQMIRISMSSDFGVMIVRDDFNVFDFDQVQAKKSLMPTKKSAMVPSKEPKVATDVAADVGELERGRVKPKLSRSLSCPSRSLDGNYIDVWWIIDDGGLTMLIPHLLSCHRLLRKSQKLRVFTVTNYNVQESSKLAKTEFRMVHLLKKFRIKAQVEAVEANLSTPANASTVNEYEGLGKKMDQLTVEEQSKTNRILRLTELVRERTTQETSMVFVTLPIPETGLPVGVYTSWLHILSDGLPPFIMMRGNNQNVMTFLS